MASGAPSSRSWATSSMASCSLRERRRSLPVVHRGFMGHRGQSDDQHLCWILPASSEVMRWMAMLPAGHRYWSALSWSTKSRLVEQAGCGVVRCQRLGDHRGNTGTFARQDVAAFVVAAIRQCDELVFRGSCLGKLGPVRQLTAVMADVGDLVGHDQVVLGIDRGLHVVAHDARAPAAGRHRSRIRIGQGDLSVLRRLQLRADLVQCLDLLLDLGETERSAFSPGLRRIAPSIAPAASAGATTASVRKSFHTASVGRDRHSDGYQQPIATRP